MSQTDIDTSIFHVTGQSNPLTNLPEPRHRCCQALLLSMCLVAMVTGQGGWVIARDGHMWTLHYYIIWVTRFHRLV